MNVRTAVVTFVALVLVVAALVDQPLPVSGPVLVGGIVQVPTMLPKRRILPQYTPSAPSAHAMSYVAPTLQVAGEGCLDANVTSAYVHSPGLQSIVIPPGSDWSFNENWQIASDQVYCAGQDFVGGGVCNMASRYSNVAHGLGLDVQNHYHGYIYDGAVPQEDNLAIMSPGTRGGQDLIIRNTTDRAAVIVATLENGQLFVSGGFQ